VARNFAFPLVTRLPGPRSSSDVRRRPLSPTLPLFFPNSPSFLEEKGLGEEGRPGGGTVEEWLRVLTTLEAAEPDRGGASMAGARGGRR
jgi:hypothetical protein